MLTVASGPLQPRTLRSAFGRYATGVVVVTTRDDTGGHRGLTVNSFTSVSLEPPLVLFCVLKRSNGYATWERAERFTMNILSATQQQVSNAFARPSTAQWQSVAWHEGTNGCAVIESASASLECRKFAHVDGGDHLIVMGEVTALRISERNEPLVFYGGKYGTYWAYQHGEPPADSSLSEYVMAGFG